MPPTPELMTRRLARLDSAVDEIVEAVGQTQAQLTELWENVKSEFVAAQISEPFPDYIQRAIPRFDLVTILRAVFSTTWEKIKGQGRPEVSRRRAAAARLGLQEEFELCLWFGPTVQSQRCWKVLSEQNLPSLTARQLFLELDRSLQERSPTKHYPTDGFMPRDFEKALKAIAEKRGQAHEGSEQLKEPHTTMLAAAGAKSQNTNPGRHAVQKSTSAETLSRSMAPPASQWNASANGSAGTSNGDGDSSDGYEASIDDHQHSGDSQQGSGDSHEGSVNHNEDSTDRDQDSTDGDLYSPHSPEDTASCGAGGSAWNDDSGIDLSNPAPEATMFVGQGDATRTSDRLLPEKRNSMIQQQRLAKQALAFTSTMGTNRLNSPNTNSSQLPSSESSIAQHAANSSTPKTPFDTKAAKMLEELHASQLTLDRARGKVTTAELQFREQKDRLEASIRQQKVDIMSRLAAIEDGPDADTGTSTTTSMADREDIFKKTVRNKRKANTELERLDAKRRGLDMSVDVLFKEMLQAIERHEERVKEELSGLPGAEKEW